VGLGAVVATAAAAHASAGGDGFLPGARPTRTATAAPMATAPTAPTRAARKVEQGGVPATTTGTAPGTPTGQVAAPMGGGRAFAAMCAPGAIHGRGMADGNREMLRAGWWHAPLRVRPVSDPADARFTQALGVNDSGTVVGYYGGGAEVGHPNHGFEVPRPYRAKDFVGRDVPETAQTQDIGINRQGVQVGFFVANDGATVGFVRADGDVRAVRNPRSAGHPSVDQLLGINARGIAAGYYDDNQGHAHGYLYDVCHQSFRSIKLPVKADEVQATGVNDAGAVSGFYTRGKVTRGFVLKDGRFTSLHLGSDTETQALGIDDAGDVVGSFVDRRGHTHGFVSSKKHQRMIDVPRARATVVNGINDHGQLVGFYTTRDGRTAGFVAS
jgi:hypothetical protein